MKFIVLKHKFIKWLHIFESDNSNKTIDMISLLKWLQNLDTTVLLGKINKLIMQDFPNIIWIIAMNSMVTVNFRSMMKVFYCKNHTLYYTKYKYSIYCICELFFLCWLNLLIGWIFERLFNQYLTHCSQHWKPEKTWKWLATMKKMGRLKSLGTTWNVSGLIWNYMLH